MSDLDLPLRDRTYAPPVGPHVTIVRGRDLPDALDHVAARPDCRALAVVGVPRSTPDLGILAGRRLLVCDGDRARMMEVARAGMAHGAAVEWLLGDSPSLVRLAEWALPVGAVVLAAGAGARMGADKLLLELDGQPMVCHAIDAAAAGGCSEVVAVYSSEAVRAVVAPSARAVANPDAQAGMASSLKVGLRALAEDCAAAVVLLGDQPLVGARSVDVLLRSWRREGARPAVAAAYRGDRTRWRPPVVIDRGLWPELMELSGDAGARQLFARHPELLDVVPAPGRPDDVDTPDDYRNIVRLFPGAR